MGEKKPVSFGSLVDAMLALEELRRVSEEGAMLARELGRSPSEQSAQEAERRVGDNGISPAEPKPACDDRSERDEETGAVGP